MNDQPQTEGTAVAELAAEPNGAAPVTEPPIDAAERRRERWSRWSDWLNPIVVREVQQALKGRVFVVSVLAACIVVISIALIVAADFDPESGGRNVFDAGLATLVPLLIFVVPMQAYQSMRHELKGGTIEQLLLSELKPWRIIVGKLGAAMVQFALYVSILSPLLATSYLLRGVDVPTIAVSLAFGLLFCVAATAFAVSSAAQGVLPAMQGIANLAVAVALAIASTSLIAYIGSGEYASNIAWLLRSDALAMVTSGLVLAGTASCVMSGLTAATFLAHAYENKSSGFRVFLLLVVGASFGWIALFVPAAAAIPAFVAGTIAMLIGSAVFGLFMVTEQRGLSPRVRAHVPRSPILALLCVPFLPGRVRGFLCYLIVAIWIGGLALLTWPSSTSRSFGLANRNEFAVLVVAYTVIYLALGLWLRGRLPKSVQGNHLARFGLPFLLFLFCIVPLLIDVFVRGGVRNWHVGHAMNPFWTINEAVFDSSDGNHATIIGLVALGVVALQVPAIIGAAREVLAASAVRRARSPAAAPPPKSS